LANRCQVCLFGFSGQLIFEAADGFLVDTEVPGDQRAALCLRPGLVRRRQGVQAPAASVPRRRQLGARAVLVVGALRLAGWRAAELQVQAAGRAAERSAS